MKKWRIQIKNSPQEISKKLESSLGSADRFVLNMKSNKEDIVKFKIHKRILVALDNSSQNRIIVNGKIFKTDSANETNLEISFTPHPLLKLLWFGTFILGLGFLAGMFIKLNSNSYVIVFGGIILAMGIFLWLHHKKEFGKNVQEYKTMISRILEI
ncbi:hypothetical protein [Salinimicrobium terrae]|uniref:hypothetical protein n=1 Tax=Salinimicrobium terrae TaxID=470866 RepID=UPI00048B4812|nr:hypothetical protein [Salinimicrobium terrae]